MIQCDRGHFYDENRYTGCPYCSQITNQPRSVMPPVAPMNMEMPKPSCGQTVAVEGVQMQPQVGKTVAIDYVEPIAPAVNKTVAITPVDEQNMPPVVPPVVPVPQPAPQQFAQQPAQQQFVPQPAPQQFAQQPAQQQFVPQPAPMQFAQQPAQQQFVPQPAPQQFAQQPAQPRFVPQPATPVMENTPSATPEIPVAPVSSESAVSQPYPVTGLGVKENPTPVPVSEPSYDRPYAVSGLAVKENPKPVAVEESTTFPVPQQEGATVGGQPTAAEASAFAAFAFPGGPIPGMMPRDPGATVAMTESDMDYLPRIHARAFLICIDGPMTGASFVFQENKAIIGRQKNYEIALFRDPSVSRSPHGVINYTKDTLTYTISKGDPEKKVSVNGTFIEQDTVLNMYDIIGIGQSRLLFLPVCSEKFSW